MPPSWRETSVSFGPCPHGDLEERRGAQTGSPSRARTAGPPGPSLHLQDLHIHYRFKLQATVYFHADETLESVWCIRDLMNAKPLQTCAASVMSGLSLVSALTLDSMWETPALFCLRGRHPSPGPRASLVPPNHFSFSCFCSSSHKFGKKVTYFNYLSELCEHLKYNQPIVPHRGSVVSPTLFRQPGENTSMAPRASVQSRWPGRRRFQTWAPQTWPRNCGVNRDAGRGVRETRLPRALVRREITLLRHRRPILKNKPR